MPTQEAPRSIARLHPLGPTRPRIRRVLLALALALGASTVAGEAAGQAMHLPPVSGAALSDTVTLLQVAYTAPAAGTARHIFDDKNVVFRIDGTTLYIRSDTRDEEFPLGDRTLADLVNAINGRFEGVRFYTTHPRQHVRELERGTEVKLAAGSTVAFTAREAPADISAAASLGFTLNEGPQDQNSALLRSAGVELDLVGGKAFERLVVRMRIGFGTAQPVPTQGIETDTASSGGAPPEGPPGVYPQGDIGSVVKLAQALTAGVNLDAPLLSTGQFRMGVGAEVSSMWAAPAPFVFPTIRLSDGFGPIEDGFTAAELAEARRTLDGIVPLLTTVAGVRMTFGDHADPKFYLSADVGQRQYHVREFEVGYHFTAPTDSTGVIRTPDELRTEMRTPWEGIYRVGLGLRVSGAANLRIDFVNALSDRPVPDSVRRGEGGVDPGRVSPLLRIAITTPDLRFGK